MKEKAALFEVDVFEVSEHGYFGEFGGAYVPEMLYGNVRELQENYLAIVQSEEFQKEFEDLLQDYVGRPSPLTHAKNLSAKYGTQVFLKREDVNHTGSHKINNTVGQILLARRLGKTRIIAETGAGQHGVATATVCALLGLPCVVYMGAVDVARQQPNVQRMNMLGAEVVAVESGSKTLKDATNEAIRDWIAHPRDTHYCIGSVVGPHPYPDMVARFQSIIGHECRAQLANAIGKETPDVILACVGGGSNAMGIFRPFLEDTHVRMIGVEAAGEGLASGRSAATLALGCPGILHGSRSILMQSDEGQILEAHSISAGLDYPGIGPQHAFLSQCKRAEYYAISDNEALEAAGELARLEGIIPALESAHALAYLRKEKFSFEQVVLICLSGRGDKDMQTYGGQ